MILPGAPELLCVRNVLAIQRTESLFVLTVALLLQQKRIPARVHMFPAVCGTEAETLRRLKNAVLPLLPLLIFRLRAERRLHFTKDPLPLRKQPREHFIDLCRRLFFQGEQKVKFGLFPRRQTREQGMKRRAEVRTERCLPESRIEIDATHMRYNLAGSRELPKKCRALHVDCRIPEFLHLFQIGPVFSLLLGIRIHLLHLCRDEIRRVREGAVRNRIEIARGVFEEILSDHFLGLRIFRERRNHRDMRLVFFGLLERQEGSVKFRMLAERRNRCLLQLSLRSRNDIRIKGLALPAAQRIDQRKVAALQSFFLLRCKGVPKQRQHALRSLFPDPSLDRIRKLRIAVAESP